MKKDTIVGGVCLCPLFSQVVHAEFIADSKAELTLRNFTSTETIKDPYPIRRPEIGHRV